MMRRNIFEDLRKAAKLTNGLDIKRKSKVLDIIQGLSQLKEEQYTKEQWKELAEFLLRNHQLDEEKSIKKQMIVILCKAFWTINQLPEKKDFDISDIKDDSNTLDTLSKLARLDKEKYTQEQWNDLLQRLTGYKYSDIQDYFIEDESIQDALLTMLYDKFWEENDWV